MSDLIPNFLTDLEAEGVSPHTVRAYGNDLRAWAKWYDQTTGGQALTALAPQVTGQGPAHLLKNAIFLHLNVNSELENDRKHFFVIEKIE